MMLFCCIPAYAETTDATATAQAQENGLYILTNQGAFDGYAVEGDSKVLVLSDDTFTLGDKESVYPDGSEMYDLGGRTIKTVALSGADYLKDIRIPDGAVEIADQVGYVDEDNALVITQLAIGNGEYTLSDTDNHTGASYYAMIRYQAAVNMVADLAGGLSSPVIWDGEGRLVSAQYVNDMKTLVGRIMAFDDDMRYTFDTTQPAENLIASEGTAKLTFHVQTNGYLGYKLAMDSIEEATIGKTEFFVVNYEDKITMIKDTDLQNLYLLMNDDEALLIDTDYFSGEDLVKQLKNVIGDRKLSVYITHAHGDHYANLQFMDAEDIDTVYYPATEDIPEQSVKELPYNLKEDFEGRLKDKVRFVQEGDVITVAGKTCEVIVSPGHTKGGTMLLDTTDRLLFSGDVLGAQTFKGGTGVMADSVADRLQEANRLIDLLGVGTKECKADAVFAGHTGYPVPMDTILWMKTALQAYQEQGSAALCQEPTGQIIVVSNGVLLTKDQIDQMFAGALDADVTTCFSMSVR